MAFELEAIEQRVLGVLVEKGYTTPEQYPLTLNAAVVASNQKSCRDPILDLDQETVLEALDSLRDRKLAVKIRTLGSRTDRYRHCMLEQLEVSNKAAAVLTELLLRGPQTDGELRQRANRMIPIENLEELQAILADLGGRSPALVRRLSPEEQQRGARYAHTFYPEGEQPPQETESTPRAARETRASPPQADEIEKLRAEIEDLKRRVSDLESAIL